jgi:hypothetical protein
MKGLVKMFKIAITDLLAKIVSYFVSATFIWWGWTVLAPHLNAPIFSYMEIFAIRMMFSSITYILWQKGVK